jgi:hypothetical protein
MARKKKKGYVVLHRSTFHCVDFATQTAQFGRSGFFGASNSLEKYRNRVLSSEFVGLLRLDEEKASRPEKCAGHL